MFYEDVKIVIVIECFKLGLWWGVVNLLLNDFGI